jgi:hypothetical protein
VTHASERVPRKCVTLTAKGFPSQVKSRKLSARFVLVRGVRRREKARATPLP